MHQFNPQDFKFTRGDEETEEGGPRSMEVDAHEPRLSQQGERTVMQEEEEEVQLRRHSSSSRRGSSAASSQQSTPSKQATRATPASRAGQSRVQRSPPVSGRRARPHSVYSLLPQPVSPTRTKKVYQGSSPHSAASSGHRRFSLASTITTSAAREAELGRVRDDGCGDSKSVPVSPEKRYVDTMRTIRYLHPVI